MDSKIIGIHDGHNAAAALLDNGKITFAVQEERFTRNKNESGIPNLSIKQLLSENNLSMHDIDIVALNGSYMRYEGLERGELMNEYENSYNFKSRLKESLKGSFIDKRYIYNKAKAREELLVKNGIERKLHRSYDHHTCHAAAAYYGSGFKEETLVLTCDGSGDRLSGSVSIGKDGKLNRIAAISEQDSIGRLYALVTYFLGMVPLEHEYKVMGLAAYVAESKMLEAKLRMFQELFEFDKKNPIVWKRKAGIPPMGIATDLISKMLQRQRFDLVAAGLQRFVELHLVQWVKNCIKETGIKNVVCSGGVFMNVKANKAILEIKDVEKLFIFPSCGDETNSMGAAYLAHVSQCISKNHKINIEKINDIYWGRNNSDSEIEDSINTFNTENKYKISFEDNIELKIAQHIADGEIVARSKGRMEFGARSLGNRSILSRADNEKNIPIINDMIKNRDFWMPFAPSVLAERADDYYFKPKPMSSPYMIMSFDSKPETRHKYIAGQHAYDFTARPQEVDKNNNAEYFKLLKHYEDITGEGIILNTSFNLHGFPIVSNPIDALKVLDRSGLRYLALGNHWIEKK